MKIALLAVAFVVVALPALACGNVYTKCCVTECYGNTCTTKCN
jgi:hypothetical protein